MILAPINVVRMLMLALFLCLSQAAAATQVIGLLEAFRLAERHDNAWAAAQKRYQATREAYPIARSALLPSLTASGTYGRTRRETDQRGLINDRYYNQHVLRLQLRQPLINLERLARVRMSERDVGIGELELSLASQDLITRVTESYFDLLLAQERVALTQAQVTAIEAQMHQAEKLREGGVATRTDVLEARAHLDRARAEQIAADNQLEISRRQLFMITGLSVTEVLPLGEAAEFLPPEPADLSVWLLGANEDALEVRANMLAAERGRINVDRARSQHLPTLDAYAAYDRASNTDIGATQDNIQRVGVELNIPLFVGGRVTAEVRESVARSEFAEENLALARRQAELAASTAFSDVTNSLARIAALEQAVHSSETALHAAEISFSVAYRTFVDVLNAQQLLFRSRFDLLGARFDYVNALVRLNAAVGMLDERVIEHIDAWLIQSKN